MAGVFSTLFGVGGGTVMVPLLVLLLRFPTKIATATSLAAIIVTATVGVISHGVLGNVDLPYALLIGTPAIAGLLMGLRLKERMSVNALTYAFAALLVVVAVWMFVEQSASGTAESLTPTRGAIVIAFGVLAGVLAALFGVGGGIVFVPVLTLVLGFPQLTAVGTSLLAIVPVSVVGSWRQHRAGTVVWGAALTMGAASAATAIAGALLADVSPPRLLRILFAGLMVFTAVQMARRARSQPRAADATTART